MDVEKKIAELFGRVVELKKSGKSDHQIIDLLGKEGVPSKIVTQIIEVVNLEIKKAQTAAVRNALGLQAVCLVTCPLSAWGFIELKALPYNLVPLNIFSINVVDSVLLTILGSLALSTFFGFFILFKAYFD